MTVDKSINQVNYMKRTFKIAAYAAAAVLAVTSCASHQTTVAGVRTEALDDEAWSSSMWISAADAEVVSVKVPDDRWHAASGASWFVSNQKNEGKVVSAKWMTKPFFTIRRLPKLLNEVCKRAVLKPILSLLTVILPKFGIL